MQQKELMEVHSMQSFLLKKYYDQIVSIFLKKWI